MIASLTGSRGLEGAFAGTLGTIFLFVLIALIFAFYFLPSVIASQRSSQHFRSIFLINLVFGWTVLGWIAALIWAIVERPVEAAPKVRQVV